MILRFCTFGKLRIFAFIFIALNVLPKNVSASEKESRCLAERLSSLKLKCAPNKITRVIKAFYGYSWSSDCHYIEKDCIVDVPADDINCAEGDCSVKIIESPIILQECWNLMASYIQVDYECIPVEELKNICDVQEGESSYGYLATPEYPLNLRSDLSCPCTLQAEKGYTITLEVIDFRVGSCSQAGLTIWSDTSTYTHCSSIPSGILPGSGGQNVSMRLHSQANKNKAGFLIKYYATPVNSEVNVKLVCYGSAQSKLPFVPKHDTTTVLSVKNVQISTRRYPINNSTATAKQWDHTRKHFKILPNVVINTSQTETNIKPNGQDKQTPNSLKSSKDAKEPEWTIIIISIVASVVFILIMINALIWFMFSLRAEKKNSNNAKFVGYDTTHFYNGPDGKLWRSSESLKAFPNGYILSQDQLPTTTWPRLNNEMQPNYTGQSLPYNYEKELKKAKASKQDKQFKDLEYIQQFCKRKNKNDEMQHFLSSAAESCSSIKFIPIQQSHEPKQKFDTNWIKYPKLQANNQQQFNYENPAVILDEPTVNRTNNNANNKNIHANADAFSTTDNSFLAPSDTVLLKSASQVPPNIRSTNSMYEEQEGSIDLHSEVTFYGKNSYKQFQNEKNTVNAKVLNNVSSTGLNSESKACYEYKEINSWKDID